MIAVGAKVAVDLIHGLDRFGGFERGESSGGAAFGVAIIHHANGGGDTLDEQGIVAGGEAVMVYLIHVHGADAVNGCDELGFRRSWDL